jgi:hypothetical protein
MGLVGREAACVSRELVFVGREATFVGREVFIVDRDPSLWVAASAATFEDLIHRGFSP